MDIITLHLVFFKNMYGSRKEDRLRFNPFSRYGPMILNPDPWAINYRRLLKISQFLVV